MLWSELCLSLLIFLYSWVIFWLSIILLVLCESPHYAIILFVLTFNFKECSCIFLLGDIYSTFLTHLWKAWKKFQETVDRMPARNFAEGTQNFHAPRTQSWYNLLFMLKSHCGCTYYCLFNFGILKWMENYLFI